MVPALAIPPLVLIAFFGVLIFAVMGRQVSEGIVSWLKGAGAVLAFLAGPTGAVAVRLTRWITHNVGAAFADVERLTVTWFSGLYQYFDLVVTNALEWPLWLWKVQRWLLFTEIPAILKRVPHAVVHTVNTIRTQIVRVEKTVVRLPKLTKAQATALISAAVAKWIHPYLAALRWVRAHFAALTHAIDHALPIPTVPTFPNIWKRIRALERKLAVPVGIAAVTAALARLGLGWIRCNKVRQVGRQVCGMDSSLLDSWLLDALAIFSVLSVVEFANELRTVEDEAIGIMGRLVREWPG